MRLRIVPISFKDSCKFVEEYHRHHKKPIGHKFSIGCNNEGLLVGVIMVGRPVSRVLDDGFTLEVTRMCSDGSKNVCSKLYSAAWRVAKNLGYRKLITYILDTEKGVTLKSVGWKQVATTKGGTWDTPSRRRKDKHPIIRKKRFEICL